MNWRGHSSEFDLIGKSKAVQRQRFKMTFQIGFPLPSQVPYLSRDVAPHDNLPAPATQDLNPKGTKRSASQRWKFRLRKPPIHSTNLPKPSSSPPPRNPRSRDFAYLNPGSSVFSRAGIKYLLTLLTYFARCRGVILSRCERGLAAKLPCFLRLATAPCRTTKLCIYIGNLSTLSTFFQAQKPSRIFPNGRPLNHLARSAITRSGLLPRNNHVSRDSAQYPPRGCP